MLHRIWCNTRSSFLFNSPRLRVKHFFPLCYVLLNHNLVQSLIGQWHGIFQLLWNFAVHSASLLIVLLHPIHIYTAPCFFSLNVRPLPIESPKKCPLHQQLTQHLSMEITCSTHQIWCECTFRGCKRLEKDSSFRKPTIKSYKCVDMALAMSGHYFNRESATRLENLLLSSVSSYTKVVQRYCR